MTIKFADSLAALCAAELSAAHGDADRIGAMIERLTSSLAFTIAMASGGRVEAMETFIAGAESYLAECATGHAKLGAFMVSGRRRA